MTMLTGFSNFDNVYAVNHLDNANIVKTNY